MRHKKFMQLGLVSAICGLAAAPAVALAQANYGQDPGQSPGMTDPQAEQYQAPGQEEPVTDAKLRSYVKATGKLYRIDSEWQPKLQGANDQDRAAMEREIQTQMVAVVEQEGLSVSEYNNIARAVQSDPALQEKAQGYMQEEQP